MKPNRTIKLTLIALCVVSLALAAGLALGAYTRRSIAASSCTEPWGGQTPSCVAIGMEIDPNG